MRKLPIILCFLLFVGFIGCKDDEGDPQATAVKHAEADAHALASNGAVTLRSQMRNPKSFEIASAIIPDGSTGLVCYVYRAQNGFGGMNVEEAVSVMNVIITSGDSEFRSFWKKNCAGKTGQDVAEDVMFDLREYDKLHGN
jgi:hypothetical protein